VGIFYECRNNGVIALVNERIFHSLNLMGDIRADVYAASSRAPQAVQSVVTKGLQHLMTPIFTFSISHRIRNRNWFTGGSYLYDAVRKHMRATNHGLCGSYSFYVPFSNGLERGHGGSDGIAFELGFVTTEQQFQDTFGEGTRELLNRYPPAA